MSQDKPVLSRDDIEEFFEHFDVEGERGTYSKLTVRKARQLCDLALSALDRQGKWVPLKPSIMLLDKMIEAWFNYATGGGRNNFINRMQAAYDAMLAAAPHNDHEPPQDRQSITTSDSQESGGEAPHPAGPASGSPELVERMEKEARIWERATHTVFGPGVAKLLNDAAQALRALEADRERILAAHKAVMRSADEYAESLQHQLDQRGEWLKVALEGWTDALGKQSGVEYLHDRIAQIRSELDEVL